MIFVARSAKPAILLSQSQNWLVALRLAKAAGDKKAFNGIRKKYGHVTIKGSLELMFSKKCAYCESEINVVTVGHIEHFKPKAKFISSTFVWNNLLLSCPKCNSKAFKGDSFPGAALGGPLVNPTVDDPLLHFDFIFEPSSKLAVLVPKTSRGQVTEKLLGLNSRKELIKARSSLIKKLIALKTYEQTDPNAAILLAEARSQEEPYLAWVRYLGL